MTKCKQIQCTGRYRLHNLGHLEDSWNWIAQIRNHTFELSKRMLTSTILIQLRKSKPNCWNLCKNTMCRLHQKCEGCQYGGKMSSYQLCKTMRIAKTFPDDHRVNAQWLLQCIPQFPVTMRPNCVKVFQCTTKASESSSRWSSIYVPSIYIWGIWKCPAQYTSSPNDSVALSFGWPDMQFEVVANIVVNKSCGHQQQL